MTRSSTPRRSWRRAIAIVAGGLTMTACGFSRQYEIQQSIADRTAIDPSLYELSIDECGTNTEPLTGGRSTIPVGRGYEYRMTITNRDSRIRQFELRVSIADAGEDIQVEDLPVIHTGRLASGESETLERKGWLGFEHLNGVSCSVEVWQSLIEILDPPPDS